MTANSPGQRMYTTHTCDAGRKKYDVYCLEYFFFQQPPTSYECESVCEKSDARHKTK